MTNNKDLLDKLSTMALTMKEAKVTNEEFNKSVEQFIHKIYQTNTKYTISMPSFSSSYGFGGKSTTISQPFYLLDDSTTIKLDDTMTTEELVSDEMENPGKWGGLDNIKKQRGG